MMGSTVANDFRAFVSRLEPGLRRALAGRMPLRDVPDALAEAFSYAWQHWDRVCVLDNPGGYLYRVAQSKSRSKRNGVLPAPEPSGMPRFEPRLAAAMRALPERQRTAIWLVHACGWSYAETAEAMSISASTVGTHLSRGMASLRDHMGVTVDE
jgi:DNA-directed RNA polymerase specialized sigma24 family protein